jgi:hypothetical protein
MQFSMCRILTTTDLIVHNDSCHPYEYKKTINYKINRMDKCPINNKNNELRIINAIKYNDYYPPQSTCIHETPTKSQTQK